MLARLSGQEHEVISAVALAQRGVLTSKLNRNVVRFRALTRAECETYWEQRRAARQGGCLRHPGPRCGVHRYAARKLFGRHGFAAVRNCRVADSRGRCRVAGLIGHERKPQAQRCHHGCRRADDLAPDVAANLSTRGNCSNRPRARARASRCCLRISPSWECAMPTSAP